MSYKLIGSEHSLYTGKLRAYLRWKGLPFEEVVASLQLYKSVILPRTGVAYIPVLVCPDNTTVLQDTHAILNMLEQHHPGRPIHPASPRRAFASMLLELYGDEWMVLPAMHYRWSFPEQQQQYLLYEFGKTNSPDKPYQEQLRIGAKAAARFSGFLGPLGISPATIPAIEARYLWQLQVLQTHLEQQQQQYLLGSSPCAGDFGLIGPLYAHLYRDPVPSSLMKARAPLVADYVERTSGLAAARADPDRIIAMGPWDPDQPKEGPLRVTRWSQAAAAAAAAVAGGSGRGGGRPQQAGPQPPQQDRQQQEGELGAHSLSSIGTIPTTTGTSSSSSKGSGSGSGSAGDSSSSCCGPCPETDGVPDSLVPLLAHMFQEQLPAILSTLQLLLQWIKTREQQQQQQHQALAERGSSMASSTKASAQTAAAAAAAAAADGWVELSRNLGQYTFRLYDPATGQPAAEGSRVGSSYVAWRAALLARWYWQLGPDAQAAVRELLGRISSHAATSSSSSSSSSSSAGMGSRAGRRVRGGTGGGGEGGTVDAAAAFDQLLCLAEACGRLERRSNRVCVWLPRLGAASSKL